MGNAKSEANGTNQGIFETGLQAGGRPMQGSPCHDPLKPQSLEAGGGGGGGEVVGLHHLLKWKLYLFGRVYNGGFHNALRLKNPEGI